MTHWFQTRLKTGKQYSKQSPDCPTLAPILMDFAQFLAVHQIGMPK